MRRQHQVEIEPSQEWTSLAKVEEWNNNWIVWGARFQIQTFNQVGEESGKCKEKPHTPMKKEQKRRKGAKQKLPECAASFFHTAREKPLVLERSPFS